MPHKSLSHNIIIAAATIITGWLLSLGLQNFRSTEVRERTMVIKGLAERDIECNLVTWELTQTVTGPERSQVLKNVQDNTKKIVEFLTQEGLSSQDITVVYPMNLRDDYNPNSFIHEGKVVEELKKDAQQNRFQGSQELRVRTSNMHIFEKLTKNSENIINLLKNSDPNYDVKLYAPQPLYYFTDLNRIKPEMLESALQNAFASAQKLIDNTPIGQKNISIKHINQGIFSIEPRDGDRFADTQRQKKVRVVSTITLVLP